MGGAHQVSTGVKRNDGDFYPTHHSLVWQLIPRIYIPKDWVLFEPACGKKDIIKALRKSGVKNKIVARDFKNGDDFLVCTDRYDMVFTNPPFSLATEFLETAFRVARHMIIFLLPLDYLHGKDRFERLWNRELGWRIHEIFVFVRRPMFTDRVRKDGKYSTGSITFAWFVLIRGEMAIPPVVHLIDNSEYIAGVKKKQKESEAQMEFEL